MTTNPDKIRRLETPGLSAKQREEQIAQLLTEAIEAQDTQDVYDLAPHWPYLTKLAQVKLENTIQQGMLKPSHFSLKAFRSIVEDARLQLEKRQQPPDPSPMQFLSQMLNSLNQQATGTQAASAEPPSFSDHGNALRLLEAHGDELRYVPLWKKWVFYRDGAWHRDDTGEIIRRCEDVVKRVYVQAGTTNDDAERKTLARWALKMESSKAVPGMLYWAQARAGVPVMPDVFDKDKWLFNCQNGTVDLRTGALREHRREDLLTKMAGTAHDPTATCPRWETFLNTIMNGNQELITFLQRAVGYTLTAITREQCMLIPHGKGRNGKSTFLETIMELMGDYAEATPTSTLMAKKSDGIPNDVARLQGARLVASEETEKGRALAESFVKQITGSKSMPARFLHGEWFSFEPVCKLWMATNHKPKISGTDDGIWRRIRLIPFLIQIPEDQVDKDLPGKLSEELPGILNWAIAGCLAWQAEGLNEPEEVKEATNQYRDEENILTPFITDRCAIDPRLKVSVKDLYLAYAHYSEETGEKPQNILGKQEFNARIKERGFEQGRSAKERYWFGIGLTTLATPPGEGEFDPTPILRELEEREAQQERERDSKQAPNEPVEQVQMVPVTQATLSHSHMTPPIAASIAPALPPVVAFAAEIFNAEVTLVSGAFPATPNREDTELEHEPVELDLSYQLQQDARASENSVVPLQQPPPCPSYCYHCGATSFRWVEIGGRYRCRSCNTAA